MFNRDVGVIWPFALTRYGQPLDLTGAAAVDFITDGESVVVPLIVSDAINGLCHYLHDGTNPSALQTGRHLGNIRVIFDSTHVYHSITTPIVIEALGTGIGALQRVA